MGEGESSDGVAIVGIAGLHLNRRLENPAPFVSEHWNLVEVEIRQWLGVGAMREQGQICRRSL